MRLVRFFILSGFLLAALSRPAAAGIGPAFSLQHLLTDMDCEAVPELLGDWTTQGDLSGSWAIQKLKDRNYRLVQKAEGPDNSNKVAFDICVAHIDGYLFFDATYQVLQPDGKKTLLGADDDLLWIPLHLIGRLEIEDDALHFRLLDDDWLQDAQKSGRVHLTCSQDDEGGYLLTAPSTELKQFAVQYASDPKAFSYAEDFARAPLEDLEPEKRNESSKMAPETGGALQIASERSKGELEMRPKWDFRDRDGVEI